MRLTSGCRACTKASLSRLSLMWLCTWQSCSRASLPRPWSKAGEQEGTKRGVTTGWTSVLLRLLHCKEHYLKDDQHRLRLIRVSAQLERKQAICAARQAVCRGVYGCQSTWVRLTLQVKFVRPLKNASLVFRLYSMRRRDRFMEARSC